VYLGKIGDHLYELDMKDVKSSRLGVIRGKEEVTDRWLKSISSMRLNENPKSVFTISLAGKREGETLVKDCLNILEFEKIPAADDTSFSKKRMELVQLYLNSISRKYNRERAGFIPLASYRKHIEGPLEGYLRAINKMEESIDKEILIKEFDTLAAVEWSYEEGKGYNYTIDQSDSYLSLLKGIWSFWLLTSSLQEENDLMLFIEVPDNLNHLESESLVKEDLKFLLGLIVDLTFDLRLAIILVSSHLYPLPELPMSHMLYFNNSATDLSFEVKEDFYSKDLLAYWEEGKFNRGLIEEIYSGGRFLIDFDL
jgi:hypothetical protein